MIDHYNGNLFIYISDIAPHQLNKETMAAAELIYMNMYVMTPSGRHRKVSLPRIILESSHRIKVLKLIYIFLIIVNTSSQRLSITCTFHSQFSWRSRASRILQRASLKNHLLI